MVDADAWLPLPDEPVPENLRALHAHLCDRLEGVSPQQDTVAACDRLAVAFEAAWAQLCSADAITSAWEPEQVVELGAMMRDLEQGYRDGLEALAALRTAHTAAAVAAAWPRLVRSFTMLAGTQRAIEDLEERLGAIEVGEEDD